MIAYFIKKYGGQVALAAPIDRGFNRLAWLLPLQHGGGGRGRAGLRRPGGWRAAPAPRGRWPASPDLRSELADKLDDELRNLD